MNTPATDKAPSIKRSRVILGATCYADAEAALNIAVAVAKQIDGELHGLLVSDEAILTAVEGPQSLTISYSGTRVAIDNAEAMRQAFRADAEHFQRRLLQLARGASLGHAFSQASGRMPRAAADIAGHGDLIVYGFRRSRGSEDGVVLIARDEPQSRLIELAGRLASALGQPLVVFAAKDQANRIAGMLDDIGIESAQVQALASGQSVLAELELIRPAAVLIGPGGPEAASIERLIDAARCPVIVPAD